MKNQTLAPTLLLLLFPAFLFSQTVENSLLWRISGKGLRGNCYLYGTMHLTDERLFQFSDSLYAAIERCDGLAMEIDPRELANAIADNMSREAESMALDKIMGDDSETMRKAREALAKKLNKSADEITPVDLLRAKSKKRTYDGKGSMPTFMDAYLGDIAYRQGKWIGALEHLPDQKALFDRMVDKADLLQLAANENDKEAQLTLEKMVKFYLAQDLSGIERFMELSDAGKDLDMVNRNHIMLHGIDSLGQQRNMVFVVGAAHLPGDEGLVNLLRKAGFRTEPVFSKKTIAPDKYTLREVPRDWLPVKSKTGMFEAQMPAEPGEMDLMGVSRMYMYTDLFSGVAYICGAVVTPYGEETIDSLKKDFVKRVFRNGKVKELGPITLGKAKGKELEAGNSEGYQRAYLLNDGNRILFASASGPDSEFRTKDQVDRFLKSFKVLDLPTVSGADGFFAYIDTLGNFSVDVPDEPTLLASGVPKSEEEAAASSIYTRMHLCSDAQTGTYYFFGTNFSAPGFAIQNDSAALVLIRENTNDKFERYDVDTIYQQNGRRVLQLSGPSTNRGLYCRAQYYMMGNYWHALVSLYDNNKPQAGVTRFFNSFKLLEIPKANWNWYTLPDNSMKLWLPEPPATVKKVEMEGEVDQSEEFRSMDAKRFDSYDITMETFDAYTCFRSDSALWAHVAGALKETEDTVLVNKPIQAGDLKGREFVWQSPNSNHLTRRRVFATGQSLVSLNVVLPASRMYSPEVNKFFEAAQLLKKYEPTTLLTSKTAILVDGLFSNDSTTFSKAHQAYYSYEFFPEDVPALQQALSRTDPVLDTLIYSSTSNLIIESLQQLKDPQSLPFAWEKWSSSTAPDKKLLYLRLISSYRSTENYQRLKAAILKDPPAVNPDFYVIFNIADSLKLIRNWFPDMYSLLDHPNWGTAVASWASTLVDSSLMTLQLTPAQEEKAMKYARYIFSETDKTQLTDYKLSLASLWAQMNTQESNEMLRKCLEVEEMQYQHSRVITLLFKNGQKVPMAAIEKLAEMPEYRIEMYKALLDIKKQDYFPKKQFSQSNFGESLVQNGASEDDYYPDKIELAEEMVETFKGKKYRFFAYKVIFSTDGEDDETYMALAGPFNMDKKDMSLEQATGFVDWDEPLRLGDINAQMKKVISQMEGWFLFPGESGE